MISLPWLQGGCLRVGLTVCFVCDTIVDGDRAKELASRDQVSVRGQCFNHYFREFVVNFWRKNGVLFLKPMSYKIF
jgi:hypothetical protein